MSRNPTNSSELWSEKYKPKIKADLAVHKKKVDDVEDWLLSNTSKNHKKKAPVLLLTGPSGCGKTVCLQLLCQELGLKVQEWYSNSELAADQFNTEDGNKSERSAVDTYQSQSQSSLFHNFLLRANKYQMLDFSSISNTRESFHHNSRQAGTVIVVKDIPNIFLREPLQFHNILRKYHLTGKSPLAVIMSESNSNSAGIQKLFPRELQQEISITNICFNPVAPTILTKVLNKVISKEALQGLTKQPSASVIETIAMSSAGDFRSALNALQFACRLDTSDLTSFCQSSSTSKRKLKGSGPKLKSKISKHTVDKTGDTTDVLAIGAKDKSIYLFHTVGKILYFKRSKPNPDEKSQSLPIRLKNYERDPLSVNPEEIVAQSLIPADFINSFLHENYVEFMTSVEDLERASEYFSDADYLSAIWTAREELQNYSLSVATRGYIHSNSDICCHDSVRTNQGWKPLHKSQWFKVSKQISENHNSTRQLFRGYHWDPEILCTEIIPYISLTNPTLHDTGQIRFVQELTQFVTSNSFTRQKLEKLDEKDVITDENEIDITDTLESQIPVTKSTNNAAAALQEDGDNLPSSQSSIQRNMQEEEEVVIEDFDDD
ncbi:Cell cycle checkpoint protein rad17 [Bulinus truncatus]|nr:Cell cycle checkpoint protein rad17 [Bulinus truncatus]